MTLPKSRLMTYFQLALYTTVLHSITILCINFFINTNFSLCLIIGDPFSPRQYKTEVYRSNNDHVIQGRMSLDKVCRDFRKPTNFQSGY